MNTPRPTIEFVLDVFSSTLEHVGQVVSDIPESRMLEQPTGLQSHPAWTLSHLCTAVALICRLLDEPINGAKEDDFARFGPRSTPVVDASQYESKTELLVKLRDRHERASAAVRAKHQEYFDRKPPEPFESFSPTIGGIVVYLLAAHESYHVGQLMQWRRAAGLLSS